MKEKNKDLLRIAEQYQINVWFDLETEEKNMGSSAGNEIWLGVFDDKELLTIAFFHELAHCLYAKVLPHNEYCSSILAQEGFCWEYGFELAAQHGYQWGIQHKVYQYAKKNLLSYVKEETYDRF